MKQDIHSPDRCVFHVIAASAVSLLLLLRLWLEMILLLRPLLIPLRILVLSGIGTWWLFLYISGHVNLLNTNNIYTYICEFQVGSLPNPTQHIYIYMWIAFYRCEFDFPHQTVFTQDGVFFRLFFPFLPLSFPFLSFSIFLLTVVSQHITLSPLLHTRLFCFFVFFFFWLSPPVVYK